MTTRSPSDSSRPAQAGPSLYDRQAALPISIPLYQHVPQRRRFDWEGFDPRRVRCPDDLPAYLVLGELDRGSLALTHDGWTACWKGAEPDTRFEIGFSLADKTIKVRQQWRGIEAGFAMGHAAASLGQLITRSLYGAFPQAWDAEAKARFEADYQLSVLPQPDDLYALCGLPDGAFRNIAFPLSVSRLRAVGPWLDGIFGKGRVCYPVAVDAKRVFQAINFVVGRAPEWTTQPTRLAEASVAETGLLPHGLPVLEQGQGSAAWTLRRDLYLVFVSVPFAWLGDALSRLASADGPVRPASAPAFAPGVVPLVLPAMLERQAEELRMRDRGGSALVTWGFRLLGGEGPARADIEVGSDEAMARLALVERIGEEVAEAIGP